MFKGLLKMGFGVGVGLGLAVAIACWGASLGATGYKYGSQKDRDRFDKLMDPAIESFKDWSQTI